MTRLQPNQYSEKEIALFTALDESHKNDPEPPTFIKLMGALTPPTLYRCAIEAAFVDNWIGPEVEALRRAYKMFLAGKIHRLTPEWDALITLE